MGQSRSLPGPAVSSEPSRRWTVYAGSNHSVIRMRSPLVLCCMMAVWALLVPRASRGETTHKTPAKTAPPRIADAPPRDRETAPSEPPAPACRCRSLLRRSR